MELPPLISSIKNIKKRLRKTLTLLGRGAVSVPVSPSRDAKSRVSGNNSSQTPQDGTSHSVVDNYQKLARNEEIPPPRGVPLTSLRVAERDVTLACDRKLQELCQTYAARLTGALQSGGPAVSLFKGYGLKARSKPRNLKAGQLALPKQENTPVDFIPRMPRQLQALFEDPKRLFGREKPQKRRKAAWMIQDDEVGPVFRELYSRGVVEFTKVKPLVTNGAFGVPKNEDWDPLSRVITDATPVNELTIDLPDTTLPNPASLSNLPKWVEFAAAGDLESYYNNLKLPVPWRKYFGFPPVRGHDIGKTDNGWYFPQSATAPMGWKGSVYVAQTFHEDLFVEFRAEELKKNSNLVYIDLSDADAVRGSYALNPEDIIFYLIYIDDVTLFGLKSAVVNRELSKLFRFYEAQGFTVKDSKTQWATRTLRVLGVWLDLITKEVLPMADKLLFLHTSLPRVAYSKRPLAEREIQSLTGLMLWNMLLFRPSLSILDSVFAFTQKLVVDGPQLLWPSVRAELLSVWSLLPMLKGKLGALVRPGAVATDATGADSTGTVGLGVAYNHNFPTATFVEKMWSEDFITLDNPAEKDWKWAVATTRQSRKPVHVQEMVGFLLGLQVAKRHGFHGEKGPVLLFNDNQGVVGAVKKGRSKCKALNCLLRRYCSWLLQNDWHIPYVPYIPTKLNPSDAPSRHFKRRYTG